MALCPSPSRSTCSTASTPQLEDVVRSESPSKTPSSEVVLDLNLAKRTSLRSASTCSTASTQQPQEPNKDVVCSESPTKSAASASPELVQSPSKSRKPVAKLNSLGASLSMSVTGLADVDFSVQLTDGEAVGSASETLASTGCAEFRSWSTIAGSICIAGVPVLPFGIQTEPSKTGELGNFVIAPGRQRGRVTHAGELTEGDGTSVKGEGVLLEVEVSNGHAAELHIKARTAKKKELAALNQERQLLKAMEKGKYNSILAQISKAKHRSCSLRIISDAEQLIRTMEIPEDSYLNQEQLKKQMKWKLITDDIEPTYDPCTNVDCACNSGSAEDGEVFTVTSGLVQVALGEIWPEAADKMLFKALVRAAITAPAGCVWRSGGKFILSNKEQNQGRDAIVNSLNNYDALAGKAMSALMSFSEMVHGVKVSACQINIHPNEDSSHKQHRDIYGAGQKGGPNCTCSFVPAVGSLCYSIGSSRHVLTETLTDTRSKYTACSEECAGTKKLHVMSSDSAMFFNGKFNNNHSHGVPKMTGKCGPRISIAFLLTKGSGVVEEVCMA